MRRANIIRWLWIGILAVGMAACLGGDEAGDDAPASEPSATSSPTLARVVSPTLGQQAAGAATSSRASSTATPVPASRIIRGATPTVTETPGTTVTGTPIVPAVQPTETSLPTATATQSPTIEALVTATETLEPTPEIPDIEEPTQEPPDDEQATLIVFEGSESAVTEAVSLEAGLAVIRMFHDGAGVASLGVWSDQTGEEVDRLSVPAGVPSSGSAVYIKEAGAYHLNVEAGGEWTINLLQPVPNRAQVDVLPWEWAGHGPQVFYFVALPSGIRTMTTAHDGDSAFVVKLLPVTDAPDLMIEQTVLEEVGGVGSTTIFEVPTGGMFVVIVEASGSWSLTIE